MKKILFCVSLLMGGVLHANGQQPLLMSEISLPSSLNLYYAWVRGGCIAQESNGDIVSSPFLVRFKSRQSFSFLTDVGSFPVWSVAKA